MSRKPVVRDTGWLFMGRGSALVFQLLYFVALARLLGVVQYGIYVGGFAFTAVGAQYGSLGMGTIFIRYVPGTRGRFAVYWGNVLLVTAVCGGFLVLALTAIGYFFLNSESAAIVFAAALENCCFSQLTIESGRVFQAFEQMRISAVLGFSTNLARACAACAMLLVLRHATAAEWACMTLAISALTAAAAVVLISIRFGRPRFAPSLVLKHGAEGLGYAFATSTSAVYNDIDKTMLCHYGMNVANAIYSIAYRVVDVVTIPFFAIREAMLPRLFQIGRKGIEEPARESLKMLMFTLPMAALSAVGIFVAAPLIPVLLGIGFSSSVSALRWLCWIPIFRSVHHMTGGALTGAGLQPYRTGAQLGAAVLNLLLNLWLIPTYGWRGAACASLATDGLLAVSCWILLAALRASERRRESRENDRICVLCRPVEID